MKYDLKSLRKKFGYVPQDGYLFSGTIEENISYSSSKIDRKKLNLATANAVIDGEIKKFPNEYKTKIEREVFNFQVVKNKEFQLLEHFTQNLKSMY